MTIGRCSLTQDPYDLEVSGDMVSFSFDLVPTAANDVNEMKARRQQLRGLLGNADEEVIPFTWSEDSTFDGFYRVRAINVPSTAVMLSTGVVPTCAITLERLAGGYANPWAEVVVQIVTRTNASGFTTPEGIGGSYVLWSTAEYSFDFGFGGSALLSRTDVDGGTTNQLVAVLQNSPLALSSYRISAPPAGFYFGSTKLEIKYGSDWHTVVGRQIPVGPFDWRISNGIVRLTAGTTSTFEVWNGTAWESQSVGLYSGPIFGAANFGDSPIAAVSFQPQLEVLRNGAEMVIVQTSGPSGTRVAYVIGRAARHVVVAFTGIIGGVGFTTANACTAITGGMRRTSNDANGNRMVFSIAEAYTTDLVNGRIYSNAAGGCSAMVGVEFNGSTAATNDTAADIVEQFMAATTSTQRMVSR